MHTKLQKGMTRKHLIQVATFGALCVMGSFLLGIETAGDVQTFGRSQAGELIPASATVLPGDMNGDGRLTIEDVMSVLEAAEGRRDVTQNMLAADPNRDGKLTVDDALKMLRTLAVR